ncbi:MAG: BlaI/MecI/CopY family transcriptional regulator [bacterium]|nr:BlaI/MecI/CopY family transcriptional regulator [bacterium]
MADKRLMNLSRRERQIMDLFFAKGHASAAEIQKALPDPPSYSTVRTQLRVLEDKGLLSHIEQGPRYVYKPTISATKARQSALRHLMSTFFDNSVDGVVSALLEMPDTKLSDDDFIRLEQIIDNARRDGK